MTVCFIRVRYMRVPYVLLLFRLSVRPSVRLSSLALFVFHQTFPFYSSSMILAPKIWWVVWQSDCWQHADGRTCLRHLNVADWMCRNENVTERRCWLARIQCTNLHSFCVKNLAVIHVEFSSNRPWGHRRTL